MTTTNKNVLKYFSNYDFIYEIEIAILFYYLLLYYKYNILIIDIS